MECRCSRWPWPQLREFWHPLSSGSCFLPILNWAARTSVLALAPADLLLPPSSSLVQRILLVQALTHLRPHRVTRFPHLFSTEATLIVAGVSYHFPVLFPEKKSLRVFVCLFVTLIFGDRIFLYSPGCPRTHSIPPFWPWTPSIDPAVLELRDLLAFASQVPLKVCATTAQLQWWFFELCVPCLGSLTCCMMSRLLNSQT